jgi:hypothetical protein
MKKPHAENGMHLGEYCDEPALLRAGLKALPRRDEI